MSGSDINALIAQGTVKPIDWNQVYQGLQTYKNVQAQQAASQIYQQTTDPNTGVVDQPRFNALVAASPQASWNAAQIMQQQGQAQSAQGEGQLQALAAHRARMDSVLGQMNGMLAKGTPIHMSDITDALNQAHLSPAEAQTVTANVNSASGGDPNYNFTDWVRNQQTSNLAAQAQIDLRTPKMQFVSTPQGLTSVDVNPNTTRTPPGTSWPFGLAPGDEVIGTDGQYHKVGDVLPPGVTIPPGAGSGPGSANRNAALLPPGASADVAAARVDQIAQRESGNRNVATGLKNPDGSPASTASGPYQFLDSSWQQAAREYGIQNPTQRAMQTDPTIQRAVAIAWMQRHGEGIWSQSAGGLPASVAASGTAPPAAAGAPPGTATTAGGPPGVQMGGAPPPPPGGAAGPGVSLGAALAGTAPNVAPRTGGPQFAVTPPPVVHTSPTLRGPGTPVAGNVNALQAGMQLARATPLPSGTVAAAGPAAGTPAVAATPEAGWGTAVGSYGGVPSAAAPRVAPTPAAAPNLNAAPPAAAPAADRTLGPLSRPPLGVPETIANDIAAYTKDAGNVAAHQNSINTLNNAYKALQIAKTGPGTQNLQRAVSFLQQIGFTGLGVGDQATQWAEANKYLLEYARTQAQLGGTDLQLLAAQGSNASVDIPQDAALAVVRNNIARERMAVAQVQEAPSAVGYVNHTKTFAPAQDLSGYQADMMTPQELQAMYAKKQTDPAAYQKFHDSIGIAIKHGLFSEADLRRAAAGPAP